MLVIIVHISMEGKVGCGCRRRPPDMGVAMNILNKQSRTADRGDPPAWALGGGLTIPYRKTNNML
jgi:hypothetical protein